MIGKKLKNILILQSLDVGMEVIWKVKMIRILKEVRMYGILGADAVGMSTACEAMAARHAGIRVCGISCVSNMASGLSGEELSHLDVQAVADRRAQEFERLVTRSIEKMCEDERSE